MQSLQGRRDADRRTEMEARLLDEDRSELYFPEGAIEKSRASVRALYREPITTAGIRRGDVLWAQFEEAVEACRKINICEPCLHTAAERRRLLHGDRPHRRAHVTYSIWSWPTRS